MINFFPIRLLGLYNPKKVKMLLLIHTNNKPLLKRFSSSLQFLPDGIVCSAGCPWDNFPVSVHFEGSYSLIDSIINYYPRFQSLCCSTFLQVASLVVFVILRSSYMRRFSLSFLLFLLSSAAVLFGFSLSRINIEHFRLFNSKPTSSPTMSILDVNSYISLFLC